MSNKIKTFDFSNPNLFVPVYVPLLHDTNRTKVIYGGRGSAKSFFAAQKKVIKCIQKPKGQFKCLMVRKMKEDVRESIFATLKKVIKQWGLGAYFRIYEGAPKIICTLNGNSFLPKGLNETGGKSGNAKSIENPTDAIVEEADEISLNEYIKLTGSLRGSDDIEEILIFNPPEDDHWLIQRFFPSPIESFEMPDGSHTYIKSPIANATVLHTSYLLNPYLNDKELEFYHTLKTSNADLYETDGLGLLKAVRTGGEALKNFDSTVHVVKDRELYNAERRALLCWDFNRRPHHTLAVWQFWYCKEDNLFYADLVKEFTLEEHSVGEVQKKANAWLKAKEYKSKYLRLIGDHSGTKQMDVDILTFIAKIEREIKRGGFEVINETAPNPRVVSSLEFLNDIFGGTVFLADQSNFPGVRIAIRVQATCKFHIADYAKTKTDKEGKLLKIQARIVIRDGTEKKTVAYEVRGHGVDQTRYMGVGVFEEEYRLFRKKD